MADDVTPAAPPHAGIRSAMPGRSLLRNSAYIMATTGINSALGYVFWIVVARTYATDEVGVASALIAAMSLLAAIANLGTSAALVQRLPTRRADADWSRTTTASLATGTVAGLAFGLVGALVLPELSSHLDAVGSQAAYALLFTVGVALWSLSVTSDYLFIAERRTENMFVRNLVFGLAKLAAVVAIAQAGDESALGIFGSWIAGCALALTVAFVVLVPRLGRRYRPTLSGVGSEIRGMGTSYAGNYVISIGNQLGVFLLPVLVVSRLSATDNAYFYVAWVLGGAFFVISSAIGSALFAEGANDPPTLDQQSRSSVRITAALLGPMMLFFFVAAGWLLGLFGQAYADHAQTLLILLTASAVPDAITNLYVARLRAQGRLAFPAAMTMGMAAITVTTAWILLPPMGLAGAGVAWLAGQCTGSVACLADALRGRSRVRTAA
ncbi:MAG TPA: lipopolysaccharide biosynthesis protein [Thermoleophilaceae bacterium]|jgi:O-antigen/teichoic acid export membrane protein